MTSPEDFTSLLGEVERKIFDRLPDETWEYPGHGHARVPKITGT